MSCGSEDAQITQQSGLIMAPVARSAQALTLRYISPPFSKQGMTFPQPLAGQSQAQKLGCLALHILMGCIVVFSELRSRDGKSNPTQRR